VPEPALDDVERDALSCHLDRVGVAQLMRGEAASHPGLGGEAAQLHAGGRRRPGPAGRRPARHTEQRTDRELRPNRYRDWRTEAVSADI
jgi:hypothetical protein